jgi:hypothetical protein
MSQPCASALVERSLVELMELGSLQSPYAAARMRVSWVIRAPPSTTANVGAARHLLYTIEMLICGITKCMRAERCTMSACGGRERAPVNCRVSGRCARPSFLSVGVEQECASRGGGVLDAPGRDSCAPAGSPRSWRPCSRPDAARCRAPWCAGTLPAHTTLALALPTLTHGRLRPRVSDNLS